MSQYIVQGIFAVAGIIALLAAILDWNWFFTARNTQFIVQNVGRRQARACSTVYWVSFSSARPSSFF